MSKTLTQDDLNQIAKHANEYGEIPENLIGQLIAQARRSLELEAKVERMRGTMHEIAAEDWIENCLDPQRAPRLARECLEDEFPEERR